MRTEILSKCLPALPLKEDTEEAQSLHELLFNLIKENSNVLSSNSTVNSLAYDALTRVKTYFASHPQSEILNLNC